VPRWIKRIIFSGAVLSLVGLFLYICLLLLQFAGIDLCFFKPESDVGSVWHLILIAITMLGVLLGAPQLAKLRAGGYEMELTLSMPFEISPMQMETTMKG